MPAGSTSRRRRPSPQPRADPQPRNRSTSAASASSAAVAFLAIAAERLDRHLASVQPQVATARPSTRAKGRKMPLRVTRWLCGPMIASREVQPSRTGSKAPSRRGAGISAGGGLAARWTRPSSRSTSSEAIAARPARASRSGSPAQRARSRSSAGAWPTSSGGPARPAPRRGRPASPAEPVADEDVGVLLADHRAAHDDPAHGGEEEEVDQRLPRVGTPAESSRSRSCSRVSGPSSASARSIVSTARSPSSGATPSWRSRRLRR